MEKALRYNENKLKWSLVHFDSLKPMVQVLEFGAKKYSPDNWKKGLDRKEILESTMRHLTALIDGEEMDPESGLSHMGHIQCNAMFYNYFINKTTDELQIKHEPNVNHKVFLYNIGDKIEVIDSTSKDFGRKGIIRSIFREYHEYAIEFPFDGLCQIRFKENQIIKKR